MAKVIREWSEEEYVEYQLRFVLDKHRWYAFPCDYKGRVDASALTPEARVNYEACEARKDTFKDVYVHEREVYITHPMIIECFDCKEHLPLDHPDCYGAVSCSCGQLYNTSGQELRPRSQWEDRLEYDDY